MPAAPKIPSGFRGHAREPRKRKSPSLFDRFVLLKAAAICAVALPASSACAQQQQAATLPNGASSLQETYQDWSLACTIQDNARACSVSQDQTQKNGQRLLAVELRAGPKGGLTGTLLLPFGILFDPGVTIQIDDQPPLGQLRFRTCLPNGCVAQFPIDRALAQKLKAGGVLTLNVITDAETKLNFPVSLKGLAAALDRVAALSGR
ncbi:MULTISPECIES: invasion associated locus B family protein [unclassified Mesorhizobium]|nr:MULTISPECIES: invasion associated locus B family protein [unclassified Mesorhizobium]MBZ9920809.1 invasion associated locus B family protein [Mesorhizobium sp. BR1-1-7]MBZ9955001.1 invasion associated locus B family protein [Mesorhizobium sp. BR1-1-15]